MKRRRIVTIGAAIIAAVAISLAVSLGDKPADQNSAAQPVRIGAASRPGPTPTSGRLPLPHLSHTPG
jgi:hypothetical protein